eukprot:TRINITY_DN24264_c0_g1_i10.p1 TRINITY_DN24264_c0_g1~~TRINITY_DN24264_c0_g1_i10.p1  ORF type:complete len:128 (-),score=19.13 TRINITY_DN24264_c0_g1_i10:78-461(-)
MLALLLQVVCIGLAARRCQGGLQTFEGRARWGDAAKANAARCVDLIKECRRPGPWLLDLSGRECKYPAAELCPKSCGLCDRVAAAEKCTSPRAQVAEPFSAGGKVDWHGYARWRVAVQVILCSKLGP